MGPFTKRKQYKKIAASLGNIQREPFFTKVQALEKFSMDAIVSLNSKNCIVSWNPAAERLFGYSFQEVYGQDVTKLMFPKSAYQPNDTLIEQIIPRGQTSSNPTILEAMGRHQNGKTFPIALSGFRSGSVKNTAFTAIIRDLTEQHEIKQNLEKTENYIKAIVNHLPIILFAIDPYGNFRLSEGKGLKNLGLKPGEVVGKSVFDLYQEYPLLIEHIRLALSGKEYTVIDTVQGIVFETRWAPLRDAQGQNLGAMGIAIDITERRKTELALRKSEFKYRQMVETTHEGIWIIDAENTTTFVNQRMAEMLGYEVEEMLGQNLFDFIGTDEEKELAAENIRQRRKGLAEQHDFRFIRKDKTEVWTLIATSPLYDEKRDYKGALGMFTDITSRKHMERALLESEQRFRTMADAVPVVIWLADAEGNATYVNKQWLQYTGRAVEQELGVGWAENLHPDDYEEGVQAYLKACREKVPYNIEYRVRRFDGKYRWFIAHAIPRYESDGSWKGYIGCCIDIHDRKEAEESLQKAYAEMERKVEQRTTDLLKINASLTENEWHLETFISTLTHDLRTPLIAQRRMLEIIKDAFTTREERDLVFLASGLIQSNDHLLDMINKLLEANQYEKGKIKLILDQINLSALLHECIEDIHLLASTKAIQLINQVPPMLPLLEGDYYQLKRVFLNLIGNAIEHIPSGCRIEIQAATTEDFITLRVKDNGPGVSEDIQPYLFERYSSSKIKQQKIGSGLGLYICKMIVDLHGGLIKMDPSVDTGTCFLIILPRKAVRHEEHS